MKHPPIYVLGYGSLMNVYSLKRTCPTAEIIELAQITEFKRIFNKPAVSFAALNIIQTNNSQDIVNAVIIEITCKEEFNDLIIREFGYNKIKLIVNNKEVYAFSSPEEPMLFKYENQTQKEYLLTCMHGAQSHGEDFYKRFLETTLIEETLLAKDSHTVKELEEE